MNKQRQVEALAKIEGYNLNPEEVVDWQKPEIWQEKDGNLDFKRNLPDYLTSHDAMQRIVDGLSDEQLNLYFHALVSQEKVGISCWSHVIRATPEQKAEAALKALGKWEESK